MRLSLATLAPAFAIAAASLLPRAAGAQSLDPGGPPDGRGTSFTGATLVICGDGTGSVAGNNACALHGGIKAYPGARGPVNAALQMEDHAKQWQQKLNPAARGGGTPQPDTARVKPASPKADTTTARKPRQAPAPLAQPLSAR